MKLERGVEEWRVDLLISAAELFSSSVCSREFINMCSEQTYRTFKCLDKEGEKLKLLMMEEFPCLNINNESQQLNKNGFDRPFQSRHSSIFQQVLTGDFKSIGRVEVLGWVGVWWFKTILLRGGRDII